MTNTIRDMCALYVVQHGYDGLVNGCAECGCDLCDLMVCCEPGTHCEAAYKYDCSRCLHGPEYDNDCEVNCQESDYIMSAAKGLCSPAYVE